MKNIKYFFVWFAEKGDNMLIKNIFIVPLEEKRVCAIAFQYVFGTTALAPILAALEIFFPNLNIIVGVGLLSVFPMMYVSNIVYEKFISHKLQKRGWNEKSFFRSFQLIITMILLLWFLPIALLVFLYQLFGI